MPSDSTGASRGLSPVLDAHIHAQAIVAASSIEEATQAIARALRSSLQADVVYVALVERGGDTLRIAAVDGDRALVHEVGATLDGAERWAVGREASWIAGATHLAGLRAGATGRDAVLAPLGARGVAVALVGNGVEATAMQIAATIGTTGHLAVEHASTLEEGRDLAVRLQALLSLQRTLASGLIEDVFSSFAIRLAEEVPFDRAYVGVFASALPMRASTSDAIEILAVHPSDDSATPTTGQSLSLAGTPIGDVLQGAQARSAGPSFLDAASARRLAPWAASAVMVPLVAHDALVGVMVLLSRASAIGARGARPLDARWLLGALAEPLAMALQNAALFVGLRTTTREWERTFDVMDALVFITDGSGLVRRANWSLARRLGVSPSALVGRAASSLFPTQQLPTPRPGHNAPVRASIVGPRNEALRASSVSLPEGGMVVVLHDVQVASGQQSPSYAALRRVTTGSNNALTRRGRVLVVDDEPSILRAVSRTLGRTHDVTTASDGSEALELIRDAEVPFDAVITDVQMAQIGGIELYHAVERDHPTLAERFVFMTGGVFPSEIEQFLRNLGARVLRKPFDPEFLRRAIDERVALSARVA